MAQVRHMKVLGVDYRPKPRGNQARVLLSPLLPQETCDNIIDHLQDDVDALRACSLVCRRWAYSAAHHLFAYLHWPLCLYSRYSGRVRNGQANGRWCSHAGQGHGPGTLLLLLTPRLSANIRHLCFVFASVPDQDWPLRGRSIERWTTQPELLALVDALPKLRSLEISSMALREHGSAESTTTARRPRTLSELTIHQDDGFEYRPTPLQMAVAPAAVQVSESNLISTICFLRHFMRIDTLSFEHIRAEHEETQRPPAATDLPQSVLEVRTLVFNQCWQSAMSIILPALQGALDLSALTTLVLDGAALYPHGPLDPALASVLPAFLRRTPRLTTLACSPRFYPALRAFAPPTLRALHLRAAQTVFTGPAHGMPPRPPAQWAALLADAPPALFPRRLRALTVHLAFAHSPHPAQARAGGGGAVPQFGAEAARMLAACDWAALAAAAACADACTLRLTICVAAQGADAEREKRRCVRAMEEIARRRVPEGVRDRVRVEVLELVDWKMW